jgi:hypothetical protein
MNSLRKESSRLDKGAWDRVYTGLNIKKEEKSSNKVRCVTEKDKANEVKCGKDKKDKSLQQKIKHG